MLARRRPRPTTTGALRVLQQIHTPATVTGLIAALADAQRPQLRAGILQALARLHYRDGVWRGTLAEWWGTRPDTTGPYYDPVAWEESARILSVLRAVVRDVDDGPAPSAADVTRLMQDLERNRVLPPGGGDVLASVTLAKDRGASGGRGRAARLAARSTSMPGAAALFARLAKERPAFRGPIVKMLAAGVVTPPAGDILRQVAVDRSADAQTRATALAGLATATGPGALERAIDGFASLDVSAPGVAPPLDSAWRQFVSSGAHAAEHRDVSRAHGVARCAKQMLGYAVLVQLAAEPVAGGRGARGGAGAAAAAADRRAAATEAARAAARKDLEAAWQGPSVASLLRAIGATEAAGYRDRIQPF